MSNADKDEVFAWRVRMTSSMRSTFADWKAEIDSCFEKRTHATLMHAADWYAKDAVMLGMSYQRMEGDMQTYHAMVSDGVKQALPRMLEIFDRMESEIPISAPLQYPAADETYRFAWLFACCVLSDDVQSIEKVRALVEHPRALLMNPNRHVERWYALLTDDGPLRERVLQQRDEDGPKMLKGLSNSLLPILSKDQVAFDALLAERAAEYAQRSRHQAQFYEHGQGKFYNRITFDAWGVIYCKLALRHGLKINIDSPHFPLDVIKSAAH